MRVQGLGFVAIGLLALCVSGCQSATGGAEDDGQLVEFVLTDAEAPGWVITPDDGPADGESPDCTGAPYDWPDMETVAHASQFLDRENRSVALVLKRVDGEASVRVEALRGALEPCAPSGALAPHGAMIDLVGDDSFAYQSRGSDQGGEFLYSNMLISCGDLLLEVASFDYSLVFDQAGLEDLAAPVVHRMASDQDC